MDFEPLSSRKMREKKEESKVFIRQIIIED